MTNFIHDASTWVLVTTALTSMLVACEWGYRVGLRQKDEGESSRAVSNTVKASVLGLVALLMGFSFSMAAGRHDVRRRLVLDEANAIGTCYLRAGLLHDPVRSLVQKNLYAYVVARLDYFDRGTDSDVMVEASSEMDRRLSAVWSAVAEGVKSDAELARTSLIVPAANEVIDLSATRGWAVRGHLPVAVLALLVACVLVACALLGHSSGQVGRRHAGLWLALNTLLALLMFVILDFDRPRRGFLQVDHTPFVELLESMKEPPASSSKS